MTVNNAKKTTLRVVTTALLVWNPAIASEQASLNTSFEFSQNIEGALIDRKKACQESRPFLALFKETRQTDSEGCQTNTRFRHEITKKLDWDYITDKPSDADFRFISGAILIYVKNDGLPTAVDSFENSKAKLNDAVRTIAPEGFRQRADSVSDSELEILPGFKNR